MLPRKLTLFCTLLLIAACAIQDSASQTALGRFQGLPLNCYGCSGEDCTTNYPGKINKCNGNINQSCGTVFSAIGTVIARGCSDAVKTTCDNTANNCLYCQSNGCNEAKSLTEYVDCLDCDTRADPNCLYDTTLIKNTRKCYKSCITALYARNKTEENPAYELARTCLDDLDLDERESCEAGDLENCAACNGANCNTVKLPDATRFKCAICEENCEEDINELECPAYRANDQCFILFENNDITRMGCVSSLDYVDLEQNKRNIYNCSGVNCNTAYSPTTYTCAVCNSANDINCVTNPSSLTVKECTQYPFTQCATYLNEEGALVRDCVANVPTDELFDVCLSNNNETCEICASNSCNKDPFPADRLTCLQCDATKDANCDIGSIEYASYCAIYNVNDKCVTKVENGLTSRGCQTQLKCNAEDGTNCRVCSGANCNTINLVKNEVGEPGKWQDLPLSCHTCEGTQCAAGLGTSQSCTGNNAQNCLTVFDTNGAVRSRGCSDVVLANQQEFCDANEDNCFICKSNNCNNAARITEYIDCYFCDSAERENCAINFVGGRTRKCKGACMVALYPGSLATVPAYETSRSCLDDKELVDQEACRAGTDKNCDFCITNNCNTKDLPEDRLSCFKCVDQDCQTQAASKCSKYQAGDQCFVLYNRTIGNVIDIGCRSDLPVETVASLIKDRNFWVCNDNNCNNLQTLPQPQSCLVCNSALDKRCISNPAALNTVETCNSVPYVDCITRVTPDGLTERGCLNSLDDDSFYNCLTGNDTLCQTCTGDNCNAQAEFPANRLRCHQCNSEKDANCAAAPNSLDTCPLYVENDSCVTTIKNSYTVRGCSSSIQCDDSSDAAACLTCNTNGCNTINLEKNFEQGAPGRWQTVPLSCYTCNSAASCATLTNPVKCTTNEHQPCYTVFDSNNIVVQRGCKDDVLATQSTYCTTSDNCFGCNSNNCNNAKALTDYVDCLFCDTERDGQCVNQVNALTTTRKCNKQCVTALYARSNETNPAYGLTRTCLDDMEVADQTACAAGNKADCRVCSGSKCNNVAIPEKRISCSHCKDENCDVPTKELCAQYRENDVCYSQYDETNTRIRLGCLSDYTIEMADYLVSQKYLLTCEGENCNEAVPTTYSCSLCNSRTDPECATNPSKVTSATTCTALPYTNCYTRVLSDGATERNCLSSLQDDEFFKCLTGQNEYCKACIGSNCNKEIYPVPRLSCHICNSDTDKNCMSKPNSLSICPIFDKTQSCISTFINSTLYRGCSTELSCQSADPKSCETCSEDGCNIGDISKSSETNFGKWQDLPLTCWDCVGEDCKSTDISQKQCVQNNEQDCITVFDTTNTVVRRGCADDVAADTYGEWCNQNPDKCYNCKSNKCNSATKITDFVSCLYCDTNTDLQCLYSPSSIATYRQCQGGCMTALYPATVSTEPAYELTRTCLNDKENDDQKTCSGGKDALCKSCLTANCNTQNVPNERLSCYQCSNAEDCDDASPALCPAYKENDQCYTLFDEENSVAQLGCASSFFASTLEEIVGTKRVQLCNGTNCNSFENIPKIQQCIVCDSNDNPDCAINAASIANLKTCSDLPYTSCFTLLANDGSTQRGCVSDLKTSDFTNCILNQYGTCETCVGDGCNKQIYPENRLQCYTCDSESDPSCDLNPTNLEYCTVFAEDIACKSALLGGNITVRGCSNDILCDATDRTSCRQCFAKGCNSIQLKDRVEDNYHGEWQSLPLKCYTCEGEQCFSSLGVSTTCEGNDNQDCMTVFYPDGNVTRRGCSDHVEDYEDLYCRQNPQNCFKCKSNECNIAWSTEDFVDCIFCDSTNNENCASHPDNVDFASRSCYQKCLVAEKGKRIIRSCLDDKELPDQATCTATNRNGCASCEGNNCNNFIFPRKPLSCHTCTDASCVNSVTKVCEYAGLNNDFCFAKYDNNRPTLLGCGGDQSDDDLFQWAEDRVLYTCDTDNCNILQNLPTPNECVTCDGNNAACAQTPENITNTKTCNALIPDCYTLITKEGLTQRGCLSDLPAEDESECIAEDRCTTCNSKTCNNKIYPENRLSCLTCKYTDDSKCYKDDNLSNFGHICRIYKAEDVCVSRVVDRRVERGCASEIDCDTKDPDLCVKCSGNNCNTELLGSSATSFSSNVLTILLACIILLAFNKCSN